MSGLRPVLYAIVALALIGLGSCSSPPPQTVREPAQRVPASEGAAELSTPTMAADSSGRIVPLLPEPRITPGDTLGVTVEDICTPGYSKKVRNVPVAVKRKAYAQYGISHRDPGEFEVDHLISLSLGGSNSIRNLWPQSYTTKPWNAHVKDALENELYRRVCSGQLDLKTVQQDIAANWIAAYRKYLHTDPSSARRPREGGEPESIGAEDRTGSAGQVAPPLPGSPVQPLADGDQVWVNTRSGKYFHRGSRYYGHTKEGEYMTRSQADQRGFVAAGGGY